VEEFLPKPHSDGPANQAHGERVTLPPPGERSKNKMATLLKTSLTQVDRPLSAKDDITLSSLLRAKAMVGRRVTIELAERAIRLL